MLHFKANREKLRECGQTCDCPLQLFNPLVKIYILFFNVLEPTILFPVFSLKSEITIIR